MKQNTHFSENGIDYLDNNIINVMSYDSHVSIVYDVSETLRTCCSRSVCKCVSEVEGGGKSK